MWRGGVSIGKSSKHSKPSRKNLLSVFPVVDLLIKISMPCPKSTFRGGTMFTPARLRDRQDRTGRESLFSGKQEALSFLATCGYMVPVSKTTSKVVPAPDSFTSPLLPNLLPLFPDCCTSPLFHRQLLPDPRGRSVVKSRG